MQSSKDNYVPPTLKCLNEGESLPFTVKPKVDIDITELKDLIHQKGINVTERAVLAKDLTLWKVRMIMAVIRSDITVDTTLAFGEYPSFPI